LDLHSGRLRLPADKSWYGILAVKTGIDLCRVFPEMAAMYRESDTIFGTLSDRTLRLNKAFSLLPGLNRMRPRESTGQRVFEMQDFHAKLAPFG